GGGPEPAREAPDPGPESHPAPAAVAAGIARPPDARLSSQWADQLVRRARARPWQGRGRVARSAYGGRFRGVPPTAGANVSAPRGARDSRQLVDAHDAGRAGVGRAAPAGPLSFHADARRLGPYA